MITTFNVRAKQLPVTGWLSSTSTQFKMSLTASVVTRDWQHRNSGHSFCGVAAYCAPMTRVQQDGNCHALHQSCGKTGTSEIKTLSAADKCSKRILKIDINNNGLAGICQAN
jgi:hypothetical protein